MQILFIPVHVTFQSAFSVFKFFFTFVLLSPQVIIMEASQIHSFSYSYKKYLSAHSVPAVVRVTGDLVVNKLSWSTLVGETVNK